MTRDVFESAVDDALDEVPQELAQHLENVRVVIEREHEDDPGLYGLYDGVPLTEWSPAAADFSAPPTVYVYRRPLFEDFGHDVHLLRREIRITVLHEIGHHFGMSEQRLAELGWA